MVLNLHQPISETSEGVNINFIEETQVYFPKEEYISQIPTSKGLQKVITPHFYYAKGKRKKVSHLLQEWVKETYTLYTGFGLNVKIGNRVLFDFHLYSYSPEAVFCAKTPVVVKPLSPLATSSTLMRLDKTNPALAQDIRTIISSAESIRSIDLKLPDNAVSKRLETYFSSEKFSKFSPKQQKAMAEVMFDFIKGKPDFYRTAEGQIYGSQHLNMYAKDVNVIGREAGEVDIQFWSYTSPSGKAEQLVNMLKPHGIKAKVIEGTQVGVVINKELIKIADIRTLYSPAEIDSVYAGWGIKNPTSLKLHFEKDVAFPFFKFGQEASVKAVSFVISNMGIAPEPKREKDIGDYYGVLKFLSRDELAQKTISSRFDIT